MTSQHAMLLKPLNLGNESLSHEDTNTKTWSIVTKNQFKIVHSVNDLLYSKKGNQGTKLRTFKRQRLVIIIIKTNVNQSC